MFFFEGHELSIAWSYVQRAQGRTMRDRKFHIATAVAIGVLLYAGLADHGKTEQRAERAERVEQTTQTQPRQDVGLTDREIANLALERVWMNATMSDKVEICYGMGADPDLTVDTFMSAQTTTNDRRLVMSFYRGKCSA